MLFTYYDLVLRQTPPFPSLADVGYLVEYPFFLLGILLLPARPIPVASRARIALDGLMIMTAALTFSWYFILGPVIQQSTGTALAKVVAAAYPLADIVLIACLVILALRPGEQALRPAAYLLALALVFYVVMDSIYGYQTLNGTYVTGTIFDVGWPVAYMLIGLGAFAVRLAPTRETMTPDEPGDTLHTGSSPVEQRVWHSLLPYALIPAVGVLVFYAWRASAGSGSLAAGVYLGGVTLIGLVLLRQVLTIVENARLYNRLQGTYLEMEQKNDQLVRSQHELRRQEEEVRQLNKDLEEANKELVAFSSEAETRYRTLVEQIPAITYVQEPLESSNPKAVTYVSPQYETILGYPPELNKIDEEHWLTTIHPEDRERVLAEEVRTDETGEPFKMEYRVIARDGRVVWLRDEATLVRDEEGQPLYWLGVQYDVTEQKQEAQERERIEQELRVARLIQQTLLPKTLPELPGYEVAAHYRPAREVGGDFYDVLELEDGRLGLVVGDATGHGVPAALMMANTQSVLRAVAQRGGSEPGRILAEVNEVLWAYMPPSMFVTCFCGILDPESGSFRYANAGHNLPYCQQEGLAIELRATGMPLGLMPGMSYEQKEITLKPGESVLLYSDGLVEAHDPRREMFGTPRLKGLVGTHPGGAALIDSLLAELEQFTGEQWEQEDDITLLTLQRSQTRS
jgi:PAS domain S-box-containing protein